MGERMPSPRRTPTAKAPSVDPALLEAFRALERAVDQLEPLIRIQAYSIAILWLRGVFKDGKQLLAYELSNGRRSTREIGRRIGVDQKTVSTWWRTWQRQFKIVEKAGSRGQFRARFSLAELLALHGEPPATWEPSSKASKSE